jgi:hypothetical protein
MAFVGAGIILAFQSVQTYIIDVFALFVAFALPVVAYLRALAGFGFPLFAPVMVCFLTPQRRSTLTFFHLFLL